MRGRRINRALRDESLDVVYDGQCRFCLRSLSLLRRIAGRPLFRLHDANEVEMVRFPMLADADTNHAMFAVTPRGEVFRGFFAFRRIMWESPRLYPLLPLFYGPGATLIGPRIYAWVARNRRRFGCSLDGAKVCGISPGPGGVAGREGAPASGLDRARRGAREATNEPA